MFMYLDQIEYMFIRSFGDPFKWLKEKREKLPLPFGGKY